MGALLIGIGNPLRRDDGVAHAVLELFRESPGVRLLSLHQLTPEVAAECAGHDPVMIIDADTSASVPALEPLDEATGNHTKALTHFFLPAGVIAIARSIYGFHGRAFLCRIPASDFDAGAGLTRRGREMVENAAGFIRYLVDNVQHGPL
jgi:hydrogenase maturation protease